MKIPKPLLEDIAFGKCLPFIGAGFSLNAELPDDKKMPDWSGLTKILVSEIGAIKEKNGPDVASVYERRFGRVQLIEKTRYALHSDIAKPGKAHRALVQLPFDTIYTTNFDLLLEDACRLASKPYRSLVGELQLPFHSGRPTANSGLLTANIVKMHGDLRHEEHIVINREDYDGFLEKYPVISTHLSAMLITRTALFIGYSLSDPDFSQIREVVHARLGRFQRMSYVIQFNQSRANVDKMLDDHLHVINFKVKAGDSIDTMLANFLEEIQEELDTLEGKKLRARKPELFEKISDTTFEAVSRAPDSSVLLSSSSNLCFVIMPFTPKFDEVYRGIIQPAAIEAGLKSLRADEMFSPGPIIEQIRSSIQQSRVCVADLSGRNSNVLYELGLAQAMGKPTVLLLEDSEDFNNLPFDVRHLRVIRYSDSLPGSLDLRQHLIKALEQVLGNDRIEEVRQLIQSGMYRAAVAMLSILLEQSLRIFLARQDTSNLQSQEKHTRPLTLGYMVTILTKLQLITEQESAQLKNIISIRNSAVHSLKEPDKMQAEMFLRFLHEFTQKYM